MKTLVIRTPDVVGNPEDFKRIGYTNIGYTAKLGLINPAKPPIIRFRFKSGGIPKVIIAGATIYGANYSNGSIDFGTPYTGSISFTDATGLGAAFAFVPTKESGFIRISNTGDAIETFCSPVTFDDSVVIDIEPSELKNTWVIFGEVENPAGYKNRFDLTGDINGFSNDALTNFLLPHATVIQSKLRNAVWDKKLPASTLTFNIGASPIKADLDMSIFGHALNGLDIRNNVGLRLLGDMTQALNVSGNVLIKDNYSQDEVTGSLNGLSPNVRRVDIVFPNIGGGYTSRTYLYNIEAMLITAPKVPATDYDLLLSDLANSPAVQSTYIALSKRTSASDASVATLVAKGCTIVIG